MQKDLVRRSYEVGAALFRFRGGRICRLRVLGEVDGLERRLAGIDPAQSSGPAGDRLARRSFPMAILSDEMMRVVEEQRLGFVATVCPDGTPNLSPKGTVSVWDPDHLVFADICSPRTVANLRGQPIMEINVVDPIRRKGYRFKGSGRVVDRGPDYDAGVQFFRRRGLVNPIRSVVLLRVERAEALVSPIYDTGATEAEVVEKWLKRTVDRFQSGGWAKGADVADSVALTPREATSTSDTNLDGRQPSGVAALACRPDELTREEWGRRDALHEALKRSTGEVIETSDGWAFRLRADPAVFSAAAEWLTLERRCCPFLRFELRWAGGAADPWLHLGGGEGVKEYLAPGARALMTRNSPS